MTRRGMGDDLQVDVAYVHGPETGTISGEILKFLGDVAGKMLVSLLEPILGAKAPRGDVVLFEDDRWEGHIRTG